MENKEIDNDMIIVKVSDVFEEYESLKICGDFSVDLPQSLCDDIDIFREIFSWDTWTNVLTDAQREYLKKFLPFLPNQDGIVHDLFSGNNCDRFGQNPLTQFHKQLKSGAFRPDFVPIRKKVKKEQSYQSHFKLIVYMEQMIRDVIVSKQRLLDSLTNETNSPTILSNDIKNNELVQSSSHEELINRCKTRFKQELAAIRTAVSNKMPLANVDSSSSDTDNSDDNNYYKNKIINSDLGFDAFNSNTLKLPKKSYKRLFVSDAQYKSILEKHKKKRKINTKPQITSDMTLKEKATLLDICKRTNFRFCKGEKQETINLTAPFNQKSLKTINEPLYDDFSQSIIDSIYRSVSESNHNNLFSLLRDVICSTPNQRMSFEKLESHLKTWREKWGIDINDWVFLKKDWSLLLGSALGFLRGELPLYTIDFVPYVEYKSEIEMYQWIGAGRDSDELLSPLFSYWILNSSKYTIVDNEQKYLKLLKTSKDNSIQQNTKNEIPLEINVKQQQSLNQQLQQLQQLQNLQPQQLQQLQPQQLQESNQLQQQQQIISKDQNIQIDDKKKKRNSIKICIEQLYEITDTDLKLFHEQERIRYENPLKPFCFKYSNCKFLVGPIRGLSSVINSKHYKTSHPLLVENRPAAVSMLSLIRDAIARLPNGEGTRNDICKLLRHSQYISNTAAENVLQTVVSGALDRIHAEFDACVKYDVIRKCWKNLHRNRTEKEFEQKHIEFINLLESKREPLVVSKKSINPSSNIILPTSTTVVQTLPFEKIPKKLIVTTAVPSHLVQVISNKSSNSTTTIYPVDSNLSITIPNSQNACKSAVTKPIEKIEISVKPANECQAQKQLAKQQLSTPLATVTSNVQKMTYTQSPIVAKVLTNSSGQVISVENLLASAKKTDLQKIPIQRQIQTNLIPIKTSVGLSQSSQNSQSISVIDLNSSQNINAINNKGNLIKKSGIRFKTVPVKSLQKPSSIVSAKVRTTNTNVPVGKLITTISGQQIIQKNNLIKNVMPVRNQNQGQIRMINAVNISSINGQNMIIQQAMPNLKTIQPVTTTSTTANIFLANRSQLITTTNNRTVVTHTATPLIQTQHNQQPIIINANAATTLSSGSQVLMATNVSNANIIRKQNTTTISNAPTVVFKMAQPIINCNQPVQLQSKSIILTNSQLNQLLPQQLFVPAATFTNLKDAQTIKVIPVTQAKPPKPIIARVVTPKTIVNQQISQPVQIVTTRIAPAANVVNKKCNLS